MDNIKRDMRALIDSVYAGEKKPLVFGEGSITSPVMLIGEAPGEQEAVQGRPFVGKAGKNLNMFLEATGLERENMYVTNVVKFRPSKISAAGRRVNRPPTREEISLCRPFLMREIEIIKPQIIVTLGNVPLGAILGAGVTIGQVHGEAVEYENAIVFPMYHPAAIIYNQSLKDVFAADMAKLAGISKNLQKNN